MTASVLAGGYEENSERGSIVVLLGLMAPGKSIRSRQPGLFVRLTKEEPA